MSCVLDLYSVLCGGSIKYVEWWIYMVCCVVDIYIVCCVVDIAC